MEIQLFMNLQDFGLIFFGMTKKDSFTVRF